MIVIRQAFEGGRWMWLVIGGEHDGFWVDAPLPPMVKLRKATEAELEEAKRKFWNLQA